MDIVLIVLVCLLLFGGLGGGWGYSHHYIGPDVGGLLWLVVMVVLVVWLIRYVTGRRGPPL